MNKFEIGDTIIRLTGMKGVPYGDPFSATEQEVKFQHKYELVERAHLIRKFVYITLEEFFDAGGKIEKGTNVYSNGQGRVVGQYLEYQSLLMCHYASNAAWKSFPIPTVNTFVKIEVDVDVKRIVTDTKI